MKKILFATFFGKPVNLELEDTDDEVWFETQMDNWQNREMKEKEEYQELKLKQEMQSFHQSRLGIIGKLKKIITNLYA